MPKSDRGKTSSVAHLLILEMVTMMIMMMIIMMMMVTLTAAKRMMRIIFPKSGKDIQTKEDYGGEDMFEIERISGKSCFHVQGVTPEL